MTKTYININGDIREVSSLKAPMDRTFRAAWQFDGDAVEIDMDTARKIHKDNLRAERTPLMDSLDVKFMKALEMGVDTKGVSTQKQALRDATKDERIVKAATPDELKSLSLDVLLGE